MSYASDLVDGNDVKYYKSVRPSFEASMTTLFDAGYVTPNILHIRITAAKYSFLEKFLYLKERSSCFRKRLIRADVSLFEFKEFVYLTTDAIALII